VSAKVFSKPPLSLADQVALLKNRGMLIADEKAAENALLHLNYYRFSGYALHYELFSGGQRTHQFAAGTRIEDVLYLYDFDSRLRALLFRFIEPVEVAFRAAVCHELCTRTNDSHWHLNPGMYDNRFHFNRLRNDCEEESERNKDEVFIRSYRIKYDQPPLPPAWMMSEILSIGRWSKIYAHLASHEAKQAVAGVFSTKPHYLQSWIHALSVLRNLCAHHSRIWNRSFKIKPALPKAFKASGSGHTRLAAQVFVLKSLLAPLEKDGEFRREWNALMDAFPGVPRRNMGFEGGGAQAGRL